MHGGGSVERVGWDCERVSEGCRNCYAERINWRLGTQLDFKPGNLFRQERVGYANGEAKLFLDEKMLLAPLSWRRPRRIFVCSMTDLFGAFVPDEMIDRVLAVIIRASWHSFQVLTKRSARMRAYFAELERLWREDPQAVCARFGWVAGWLPDFPIKNLWLGVSAEDQRRAAERIPDLLATPAVVRFVSAEPLLGPIDFRAIDISGDEEILPLGAGWLNRLDEVGGAEHARLNWVIVGGESGPEARPMHPEWARSIRDQCAAADVPFFFKQWGDWAPGECASRSPTRTEQVAWWDFDRWFASALTPRESAEMHVDEEPDVFRLDKKVAGRLLDGRTWDEMPGVRHG